MTSRGRAMFDRDERTDELLDESSNSNGTRGGERARDLLRDAISDETTDDKRRSRPSFSATFHVKKTRRRVPRDVDERRVHAASGHLDVAIFESASLLRPGPRCLRSRRVTSPARGEARCLV